MVKLTGPIMSAKAAGSLADAITFSQSKGRSYAKKRAVPTDPKSVAQVSRRALWNFLTKAWAGLSDADKATWSPWAALNQKSAFNAYLGYNAATWQHFLPPSKTYPPARSLDPSDRKLDLCEWVQHQVRIRTNATAANSQWGLIIHQGYPFDYAVTIDTPIIFELDEDLATHNTFWTYKEKIPLRFKSQPFSIDGKLGPITNSWTLNP